MVDKAVASGPAGGAAVLLGSDAGDSWAVSMAQGTHSTNLILSGLFDTSAHMPEVAHDLGAAAQVLEHDDLGGDMVGTWGSGQP